MLWMNNWEVQSFRALDSHRTAIKTSELARQKKFFAFKTPIHDFRKQNNLFHLNSIRCNHRHRCYNYRRHTTTKTEVFALVRNSHRTLQLTVEKHSFLSKCRFTISHEHNNLFHLNFIYRHHSNFPTTVNFFSNIFRTRRWPPDPHDFTHD